MRATRSPMRCCAERDISSLRQTARSPDERSDIRDIRRLAPRRDRPRMSLRSCGLHISSFLASLSLSLPLAGLLSLPVLSFAIPLPPRTRGSGAPRRRASACEAPAACVAMQPRRSACERPRAPLAIGGRAPLGAPPWRFLARARASCSRHCPPGRPASSRGQGSLAGGVLEPPSVRLRPPAADATPGPTFGTSPETPLRAGMRDI